jgi:hypothetical protein
LRLGLPELLVLVGFAVLTIPTLFYPLSLRKALARCAPDSRTIRPDWVWLLLIPCVNLIVEFFLVHHLAKSLRRELDRRAIAEPAAEPGKQLGFIMCVVHLITVVSLGIPSVSQLLSSSLTAVLLFVLPGIGCWILYWVRISRYSRRMATPYAGYASRPLPVPEQRQ